MISRSLEKGIILTEDDFNPQGVEISDDELDVVTGGAVCDCWDLGSGEESGEHDDECSCYIVGEGHGTGILEEESRRCDCVFSGGGRSFG